MANKDFLFRAKADTSNYDANLAKARRQLDGFAKANLSAGGAIKQLSGSLVSVAARFASVTAAVGALGAAFRSNIATAMGFEKSMSQLSSLTGMVGKDLEKLKGYAIDLGSSTTLTASQVADAFKMIGSQQPQLLQSGEALKQVTKYAIQLSEAAGIELATAAQTLSTSINQMGGDSSNAARFVNVLAAASQKGAGDIAWLGEALTKSATAAKAVGTEYEELVANLEQLAKAGFDAATAGTALRSIIMNLEKQSNQDFKPSVVGLTQAFENLGKANLSLTEYQELAGKLFATQTKVLAEAAGEARNMTEAITGTNIAEEQARTNTDNLDGSLKSLSSAWEGLNLHVNDSNGFLRECVDWLKDVVKWADQAFTSAGRAANLLAQIRGGEGQNHADIVQSRLDALRNASPEERETVNRRNAEYFSSMESQAWKMAQQTKAELDNTWRGRSIKRYNLQRQYEKYVNSANSYRALGQEYANSASAIISPVPAAVVPDVAQPSTSSSGKGKVSEIYPEGSLKQLQKELNELQDAQSLVTSTEEWKRYQTQIDGVNKSIDALKGKVETVDLLPDLDAAVEGVSPLEALKEKIRTELAEANSLIDETTLSTLLKASIENGLEGLDLDFTAIQEKMGEGLDIPDEAWEALQEKINEKLKELGIDPIQLDFSTGNASTGKSNTSRETYGVDAISKVSSGINSMVASMDQLGVEIPSGLKEVLGGINAVVSILTTISAIMEAIEAIQSATSFMPFFAKGGIVPKAANGYYVAGNSFSGDNTPILANAGELVLNKAAQGNLASLLQDGGNRGGVSTPYVSGEQIFFGLTNYLSRTGKGELVTSRK